VLGWQPRTDLNAGLTRTVAYFEKLLSRRGPMLGQRASRPAPLPVK
jgi:hypothetical protein